MARGRLYPPSVDPGFPTLAEIPSGWRSATFGDLLDVVERPIKLAPDKTYKLVNAKRSRGGVVLRGEQLGREILTKTQFEAREGDFLISRRQIIHGACGVVPPALDGAIVSNEYSTLREKAGVLLMEFLRQFSHTSYFQRTCFHSSHGVDVEKMIFKLNEWLKREVHVPPLPEQRKIAAILSSVDEAIEATQTVIDQLQVVKKAMMAELLTRGLPGRHTRFKQTKIGEVPEEWEVVPLGRLGEFQPGYAFKSADFASSGDRLLRGSNIGVGCLNWAPDRTVFFPTERRDDFSEYVLEVGDIVVAMDRPFIGAGFKIARLTCTDLPALLLQRVGRFRRLRTTSDYLWSVLNSDFVQGRLRSLQKGTDLPHISKAELESCVVPLPGADEQEKIGALIRQVDARLFAEEEALGATAVLKNALQSALLTGELRVSPDEPSP